jgi:metallo-beta-lactamase family protein
MTAKQTLRFLGGAGTVTGSKFLVTSGDSRVLIDCGMYQGVRSLRERNWQPVATDAWSLDAVVLTHAHVDHSGLLPRLVDAGFDGPIYATPTTADLAGIVLPDCGHLNEEEAELANRGGWSRHEPALPLYTEESARATCQYFRPLEFGHTIEIAPNVELTLSRAGHILGAASVRLQLDGTSIGFSGDLGTMRHPLLVPPDPAPSVEHLLVESTYGDRRHDPASGDDVLVDAITGTIERGGSVLIPAFAVDRTEVLLQHLSVLQRRGRVPTEVPVYVDSPMALAALDVYRAAIDRGDADVRPDIRTTGDLFDLRNLIAVRDVDGSKALNEPSRPSIIISAAGMASGGRVVHHLAHMLPDPRHTIVLVGYQAVGTRGRQLLEGATELKIHGRYVRVRSRVVNAPYFSVHADAGELVEWVGSGRTIPRTVYVVHGEPSASAALAGDITARLDWTAVVPRLDEIVRLALGDTPAPASGSAGSLVTT